MGSTVSGGSTEMEEKSIIHIEGDGNNLGNGQIGVESVVDPTLGYRMWVGKDMQGFVTKWLAKGKPGLLTTLQLSGASTIGSVGYLKHDAQGNITGGHAGSGGEGTGNRNYGEWIIQTDTPVPTEGQIYYGFGNGVVTINVHKSNVYGEKIELLRQLKLNATISCWSANSDLTYFSFTADQGVTDQGDYWQFQGYILTNFGELVDGTTVSVDFKNAPSSTTTEVEKITFTVANEGGSLLSKLKPAQVLTTWLGSTIPTVGSCQANNKNSCTNIVLLLEDIANSSTGRAIRAGLHSGIDTSNLTLNAVYYVDPSTPNEITAIEPAYPNLSCRLFKCVKVSATEGVIDVMIDADPQYQIGTASTSAQMETFSIAVTNQNTQVQSGQASQWSMTATMVLPKDIINISTTSRMTCFVSQGTGNFMMAIYKKETDDSLTRLAYTPILTASGTGFISSTIAIDNQFAASDTLYFAILTSANALYFRGISSFLSNTQPYVNGRRTNMGTLTVPPLTTTFDGEFGNAMYMQLER